MKFFLLLLLYFVTSPLTAQKQQPVYQDGILKSFRTATTGKACNTTGDTNGTIRANTDSTGNTTGTVNATTDSSTTCRQLTRVFYTIAIGDNLFVITPKISTVETGASVLTMGLSSMFHKQSVLYGQLPGTLIKVRSDNGNFYVKIGKRETEYRIASAE